MNGELASGAVRMSLERNGDLNPLLAERPVMRHWDFSEHRQLHSMLINGVDCSIRTSFYYLSKMFRDHTFDVCLDAGIQGMKGLQNIFVTMGYDSESKEYILKTGGGTSNSSERIWEKDTGTKNNIESGTRKE